ncbi:hypothetical protein IGI04_042208, partial [Brassica rapa subsp. trilocularis]
MDSNELSMVEETRSRSEEKKERENECAWWSSWIKTAWESCGIWSNHEKEEPLKVRAAEKDQTASLEEIQVKVEPLREVAAEAGQTARLEEIQVKVESLKEVAAEEGQTARLEVHEAKGVIYSLRQGKDELYQLVGRLREVESKLSMVKTHTASPSWCQGRRKQNVIFGFLMGEICELVEHMCDVWEINNKADRWKRGTSCKKGKLRKLSKMWVMMSRLWRKDIKESMQVGECLYSAYIGESVESSGVMRKLETKGADEPVTKEEWDEFVKGNGTESGEQEQNQEDSGLHDQNTSQEVENNVQSSGEVDEVQSSGEVDEVQSSREEQVRPASSEEEQVEPAKLLQQDVDIKETINKEVKTEERWAVWSWIVTGPNGWEDFESLTRPVTCTLNGSPLPLGDSKHPSCLLLFYISHSYALHSKLGLSCTDRLVLQELLQQDVDIKETINKEVKTEERWAVWSWIVTGPNGWEDFESLTRPVTCTLNGSPLPLGDSKHPSCLLLFYISHSYALHSKLGLSCTDRLVLQGKLSNCLIRMLRKLPWITLVRRSTPKRDQDKGGAVWIRSGHSWKGKATLQPVQACEASQQPASLDFTCFQSHFEIPF